LKAKPAPYFATMEKYQYSGPVDCDTEFTTENVGGKTAIVTGGLPFFPFLNAQKLIQEGSKGIGQGYVRALAKAG
jgi:hypothetical protein